MPVRSTEFVPMPASAKKAFALRLDPSLYAAVERLAAAELRSANAEIEVLLREALARRGVSVKQSDTPKRGRPPKKESRHVAPVHAQGAMVPAEKSWLWHGVTNRR